MADTTTASEPSVAEVPGARFLRREREALERLLPGLDTKLSGVPLMELEARDNPGIQWFKEAKGTNLVIPKKYGGVGANAIEVMEVHRAIASRSPSLAIVSTMHNFSASTLVEYAVFGEEYGEALLGSIAEDAMLLASGFGEARPGARPLEMTMQAKAGPDQTWIINGRKKPCTLSRSMDFLTAGVTATGADGVPHRAVAIIPADIPGLDRRPFWESPVLGGAESDEVILTDVTIPEDFVFLADNNEALDPVELTGYVWFQMCLCASYLGVGSALVERVLQLGTKINPIERMAILTEIETAFTALERVAQGMASGEETERLLARIVSVRYAAMGALERSSMRCAELLGGIAFIKSPDVCYLMAATRGLAFHPPSRAFGSTKLSDYYDGAVLDLA